MSLENSSGVTALVLAKLSCADPARGLTLYELRRSLFRFARARLSPAEWRTALSAAVEELTVAELVWPQGQHFKLTARGREHLRGLLGEPKLASRATWKALLQRLTGIGFGELPPAAFVSPEAMRVALAARAENLELEGRLSEATLRHALLARQLGLDPRRRVTLRAIQARVLSPLLGATGEINPDRLVTLLAARASGARDGHPKSLQAAGLTKLLFEPRSASHPPAGTPSFVHDVLEVAHSTPASARFGEDKVFISEIWKRLSRTPNHASWTERQFKKLLGEANGRGELQLGRADLVEVMEPALVAASETRFHNATFHFVRL